MLRIVKNRNWHCAYTKACIFERLGPGLREPTTNQTFCTTHAAAVEQQWRRGGNAGAEAAAGIHIPRTPRQGGQ